MLMWLCEDKLKGKTADFRWPSASQKRACLSSLLTSLSQPQQQPQPQKQLQNEELVAGGWWQTVVRNTALIQCHAVMDGFTSV